MLMPTLRQNITLPKPGISEHDPRLGSWSRLTLVANSPILCAFVEVRRIHSAGSTRGSIMRHQHGCRPGLTRSPCPGEAWPSTKSRMFPKMR